MWSLSCYSFAWILSITSNQKNVVQISPKTLRCRQITSRLPCRIWREFGEEKRGREGAGAKKRGREDGKKKVKRMFVTASVFVATVLCIAFFSLLSIYLVLHAHVVCGFQLHVFCVRYKDQIEELLSLSWFNFAHSEHATFQTLALNFHFIRNREDSMINVVAVLYWTCC